MASIWRANWGRVAVRQARAHEKKKRCGPVSSSMTGAVCGVSPCSARAATHAFHAIVMPPRSPMFSPMVRAPLTWGSERSALSPPASSPASSLVAQASTAGVRTSYCPMSAWVRSSKAALSWSVHQFDRLPAPS